MCAQTSVVVQLQIASLVYGVEAGIRVGDAVKSISAGDVHRPLGSLWTASVYSVGVPTDSRWPTRSCFPAYQVDPRGACTCLDGGCVRAGAFRGASTSSVSRSREVYRPTSGR